MMIRALIFPALFFLTLASEGSAGINSAEAIGVGGIKQWISIKGANRTAPVLLFLHGGPGSAAMSYGDKFTSLLQKEFVVVQWDQRESGKTAKLNRSPQPLTVALFESDTFEVINYLRARFSQERIYLMGHSWGGFLGLNAAANHPELIMAFIAICPMIYQAESERETLDIMRTKAKADNNQNELTELAEIDIPFQNGRQLYFHRKWLAILMGQKPYGQNFVEPWAVKWLPLFNEASMVNFFEAAPEIRCPVYFFLSNRDYQTYFKLTEKYYQQVKADKKEIFWFTNSAHAVIISEPQKLQEIIIDRILHKPTN